jgi:hypothetical protein
LYDFYSGQLVKQIHVPKGEVFTALYYNKNNKILTAATLSLSLKSHFIEYDINNFNPIMKTTCKYIPSIKKLYEAGSLFYTINEYEKSDHYNRRYHDGSVNKKSICYINEKLEFSIVNKESGDIKFHFEIPAQDIPESGLVSSDFKISKDRHYLILFSYEALSGFSNSDHYSPQIFIYNLKEKKEVGSYTIRNIKNFKWLDISSNNEIIIKGDKSTKYKLENYGE